MSNNACHEVIPLSKYLGTNSCSFDKGYGIRKWDLIENCEETFAENFFDKIKEAISKSRTRRRASFNVSMQSCSTLNSEDEFSPPDVSNLKIVQKDSGRSVALNTEKFLASQTKPLVLSPTSSSSPYDSMRPMKTCELSDVLWKSLNDDRQYVNIEGLHCPKTLLAELATQYLNDSRLKDTAVASVQTNLLKSETPTISIACQTEAVPPTLDGRSHSEEIKSLIEIPPIQHPGHQNFIWNNTVNANCHAVSQTNQTMYYPTYQPTHALQSQSSQFSNHYGQYHQNSRINQYKLNGALNWKPRNEKQKEAFEQTRQDLFNLLVAYKGVSYRHVIKQFLRTVQEPLDFHRMGICDLRSLLVQMKDLVILKKHQFREEYFLFPKMNNDEFKNVSHIAELVAEQRDRDVVPLPNEATLVECDISKLFEEEIPQTTYRYENNSDFNPYQMYLNYCWYCAYNSNNYNYSTQNNYYSQHQNQQYQFYQQNYSENMGTQQNTMAYYNNVPSYSYYRR